MRDRLLLIRVVASMSFRGTGGWRQNRGRQHQREARAFAGFAGHFDLPTVLFYNLLDDRQPDSGASFSRFFGLLSPVKLMKNLLHFFRIHADPLVLDGYPEMTLIAGG